MLVLMCACSKKQVKDDTMLTPSGSDLRAESQEGVLGEGTLEEAEIDTSAFREVSETDTALQAVFADIYFDFDDFSLRPDAKAVLQGIADWLLSNPSSQVLIEGHCDERGTNEYNLALGERRAASAKKYLIQLGVSPKRLSTISYGEERPLDPASNEAAWTKNRRAHFLLR